MDTPSLTDRRPSWEAVLGVAALCAVPLVLHFPQLFEGRTFYLLDISWFHYPSRVYAKRLLMAGRLPLWNAHILCGFPMHAEGQISVFYPLNAVFLLPVPEWQALSWYVVAHYLLAGLGTYALATNAGVSAAGGAIAGLVFAFGGYPMAQVPNLNILTGLAWLPLALLAAQHAGRRGTWPAGAGLATVLAVQTLGSHPQVSFYTMAIAPAYAALHAWSAGRGRGLVRRLLIGVAAPVLLAGALSAVQVLPTLDLKAYSPRSAGLDYGALTIRSLPPRDLLTFVSPHVFGTPLAGYMGDYDYMQHGYVGALALLLALAAASRPRGAAPAFFTVLAAGALVLALGRYTPLYRPLAAVPGFNWFRAPMRWLGPMGLALALLAGWGWDRLLKSGGPVALVAAAAAGLLAAACLAGGAWATMQRGALAAYAENTMRAAWNGSVPGFMVERVVDGAIRSAFASAACWAAAAGVFALASRGARRALAAGAAVVLVAVDLSWFGAALTANVHPDYFTQPSWAAAVLRRRPGLHRLCPPRRGDVMATLRENVPSLYGLFSTAGHLGQIAPSRSVRLARAAAASPSLLDVMGVRDVIRPRPSAAGSVPFGVELPELADNPRPWPRCWIAGKVTAGLEGEVVFERMASGAIAPREALLEAPSQWAGAQGEAAIIRYGPCRVLAHANAERAGLLVLTDTWQPGWRAYVDGRREPVRVANYAFRAVPLPAGRSRVSFVYAPRSFALGAFLSLVAGACVVALLLALRGKAHHTTTAAS